VNLVEKKHVEEFSTKLAAKYFEFSGKKAPVFVSAISDGAHVLPL
jgi:galactokinase